MTHHICHTRFRSDTYHARAAGVKASATSGEQNAVLAVAAKLATRPDGAVSEFGAHPKTRCRLSDKGWEPGCWGIFIRD